ncbi:disease resistance protein RPV1-like [Alnus glutinosa]|uniref:disease resistance protein RPV1-like n=1 Tax=Alnus glutinosa TaxID=3517 RepID=UPI002D797314|nr:disease resistance protein RPV1-like [Alnus glutinosa]
MDRREGQATTATPSSKTEVPVVEDPEKDVQLPNSMAIQTLPSPSKPRRSHDVFLSFRGEDTRKNFTDHLYTALDQAGIRTFRDDNEQLPTGNDISTELLNVIQGSRISIVIFSKNYASSTWCLNELVEIVHCKNTIGHTLIPIFYHVDPSEVRKQTGTFEKAFAKHEEQFHTDMKRVGRWRQALTEAANCFGLDLKNANGYEARLVQKILKDVSRKMSSKRWESRECNCGTKTYLTTSYTKDNLGRRFFGCSRYKERSRCSFFEWFDPPICARGGKLILDMRKRIKSLEEQLRKQAAKLRRARVRLIVS